MSLLLELLILISKEGQACSTGLRQMFHTMFTPFEHPLTFGQFRIRDSLFCVPMIGIQIEWDQPVSNAVFLTVPALEIGLGEFDGFPYSAGGDHRDEFREALRRGIRCGLPSFLPELHLVGSQVSPPISIGDLIGPFTKH